MKLVLKNIKNSFKAYRSIYAILILTQFVAVTILLFVYGIVVSYDAQKTMVVTETQVFNAPFWEGEHTVGELKECITEILDQTEDRLDYFFVSAYDPTVICSDTALDNYSLRLFIHNEYRNGSYYMSQYVYGDGVPQGRIMTNEETDSGAKVIIGANIGEIGDTFTISGEQFEIIGKDSFGGAPTKGAYITLMGCPDDVKIGWFSLVFEDLPTQADYNCFKSVLEAHFGKDIEVQEYEVLDRETIIAYDSMIMLAIAIGIVAALDTVLVYGYIMKKRKRQMAIFGIAGANNLQRIVINELEIVIVTLLTSIIGGIFFKLVLENVIYKIYDIGVIIYTFKVYLMMIGMYFGSIFVATLIMTICTTKRKFLEIRRG